MYTIFVMGQVTIVLREGGVEKVIRVQTVLIPIVVIHCIDKYAEHRSKTHFEKT